MKLSKSSVVDHKQLNETFPRPQCGFVNTLYIELCIVTYTFRAINHRRMSASQSQSTSSTVERGDKTLSGWVTLVKRKLVHSNENKVFLITLTMEKPYYSSVIC